MNPLQRTEVQSFAAGVAVIGEVLPPHVAADTGEVHGVGQVTWPTRRLRGTCESRNHILNRLTQIHLLTWRSLLQEVRDRGQGQQPQHHAGGGQPCEGDDGVRNTWRLP